MELLVGALEEAELAGKLPLLLGEEGDVQAGDAEPVSHLHRRLKQDRLALGLAFARAHEQTLAGDRREGDRGLELRIIVAAGARHRRRPSHGRTHIRLVSATSDSRA